MDVVIATLVGTAVGAAASLAGTLLTLRHERRSAERQIATEAEARQRQAVYAEAIRLQDATAEILHAVALSIASRRNGAIDRFAAESARAYHTMHAIASAARLGDQRLLDLTRELNALANRARDEPDETAALATLARLERVCLIIHQRVSRVLHESSSRQRDEHGGGNVREGDAL